MYGKRHRLSIAESAIIANHVILSYLLCSAHVYLYTCGAACTFRKCRKTRMRALLASWRKGEKKGEKKRKMDNRLLTCCYINFLENLFIVFTDTQSLCAYSFSYFQVGIAITPIIATTSSCRLVRECSTFSIYFLTLVNFSLTHY